MLFHVHWVGIPEIVLFLSIIVTVSRSLRPQIYLVRIIDLSLVLSDFGLGFGIIVKE